jgi:sulfatase modifying factor 1
MGAYTLLGGTPTPSNGDTVTRNPGATIVLTSEDEWYKSAYYSAASTSYFDYPAASSAQPACIAPTAALNSANCGNALGDFTNVGSYTGSASPYGTYDQGGNIWEWNEEIFASNRGILGGGWFHDPVDMAAFERDLANGLGPDSESSGTGFRLVMIPGGYVPEPDTGLLVIAGLLGLTTQRRRTSRARPR